MLALEINSLSKIYESNVCALDDVSFNVKQGDFFALLGPNGAGKSTAIGIITSLVNKTAGEVKIMGHCLDKEQSLAKLKVGLIPQEFNFHVFETVQNIVVNQAGYYGIERKQAKKSAQYYLTKLGLWDKRNMQARTLSGGMKRRLMIARGLVHEPDIILLDEPTAGVDIELRHSMWDFLREVNASGKTIVLTTHYLEEAEQLCRNIAIIHKGKVVADTSMRELLARMQRETIVIDVSESLSFVPVIDNFDFQRIDDYSYEVSFQRGLALNELFEQLTAKGIGVRSFRNKLNRLEQLFLNLTQG